ncbi:MAG: ACP S-malonyltransferase [Planctomycetota bacterium]
MHIDPTSFVILFPGQGAQRVGMGRDLAEAYPEARAVFDRASEALGRDVAALCFEGPRDELNRTSLAQPAILTTSIAALEAWRAHGDEEPATAAAGLSLGEYTALVYAGALDFEEAVGLVHQRGTFMEEAGRQNPGGMVTLLGLDRERVNDVLEGANEHGYAVAANYNAPGQIVFSGNQPAVEWMTAHAKDFGALRAVRLRVSGAFHSRLMEPAAERLAEALGAVAVSQPHTPVIANVTAKPVTDAAEVRGLLVDQLTSPVLWEDSMRYLVANGVRRCVEVGPGTVLTGLLRRIDERVEPRNIQAPGDIEPPAEGAGEG